MRETREASGLPAIAWRGKGGGIGEEGGGRWGGGGGGSLGKEDLSIVLSIANLVEVVDVGLVMEVVVDFHRLRVNVWLESILRQGRRINSIRTQRGDTRATQTNTEGGSCDRGACRVSVREEGALYGERST